MPAYDCLLEEHLVAGRRAETLYMWAEGAEGGQTGNFCARGLNEMRVGRVSKIGGFSSTSHDQWVEIRLLVLIRNTAELLLPSLGL